MTIYYVQKYSTSALAQWGIAEQSEQPPHKTENVIWSFIFLERGDHSIGFWAALNIYQTSQRTFSPKRKLNTWVNFANTMDMI